MKSIWYKNWEGKWTKSDLKPTKANLEYVRKNLALPEIEVSFLFMRHVVVNAGIVLKVVVISIVPMMKLKMVLM